jgi:hypothetical protein
MRQLASLDAQFLAVETPRAFGHVVSTIVDGVGLNITVISYRDHMDVGIIGDRDQLEDAWTMLDGLRAALQEFHGLLGADAAAAAPAPKLVSP